MGQGHLAAHLDVRWQGPQKIHGIRRHYLFGPGQGSTGVAVEGFKSHPAQNSHIVVCQNTGQLRELPHTLDHHIWIGPVTHEVAETPGLIGLARILEHGFQSRVVGVNVRNDQDTHAQSKSVARRSTMISATSVLVINGRGSCFPFGYNKTTRLVSRPKPASLDEISFATIMSSFLDLSFSPAFSSRACDSAAKPTVM